MVTADEQIDIGELLEQAAGELSDMVIGVKADGSMYYISPSVENVLGYSDRVFQRLYNHAVTYKDDRRFLGVQKFVFRQLDKLKAEMDTGYACEPETLAVNHRDGFRVSLHVQCIPTVAEENQLRGAVCICRDISARKQQLDDVALAKAVFENSMIGIYVTDAYGKIIQANSTFSRLSGYQPLEVIGCTPQLIDIQRYSPDFFQDIKQSLEERDFWEGEIHHRHKDGHVFAAWVAITVLRDRNNKVVNTISYLSDLTEKQNSEHKIHRLAYFDPLTGLPNRSLFYDRLTQAVHHAHRTRSEVALLLLDLSDFKFINQRFGHALGDALLHQIGQRIVHCVRSEDTVARMGGDEFAVILGGMGNRAQLLSAATKIATKICRTLEQPFCVRGQEVVSGASIGIACYPMDGRESETLLQHADSALAEARAAGKGHYQFYGVSTDVDRDAIVRISRI